MTMDYALYQNLLYELEQQGLKKFDRNLEQVDIKVSTQRILIIPAQQQRYLAEIAQEVRDYHDIVAKQVGIAREHQQLVASKGMLDAEGQESSNLDS
ncbi:MAG: hypothetical protein Ct9H300mP22_2210 [Gammaproteobacteria bacterium]|nr:MAG: hypothetical protein Ct9H300mP22_2210 [Gammaproteobacteria bacterium]